jgi:cytochrome c-type biogenesis protein CcmH/NrfG
MSLLYGLLALMMVASMCLNVVPFVTNKSICTKRFVIVILLSCFFAMGLYRFSGDKQALNQWLTTGKSHYQLQESVNQLGGIKGMISHSKRKVQANPLDAQGWLILGKLYLAEQDVQAAKAAFSKAHKLQPQDEKINYYYQTTSGDKAQ